MLNTIINKVHRLSRHQLQFVRIEISNTLDAYSEHIMACGDMVSNILFTKHHKLYEQLLYHIYEYSSHLTKTADYKHVIDYHFNKFIIEEPTNVPHSISIHDKITCQSLSLAVKDKVLNENYSYLVNVVNYMKWEHTKYYYFSFAKLLDSCVVLTFQLA